jgi:hypothetical protein
LYSKELVFERYATWNGQVFPIVLMPEMLAIRVSLPCGQVRQESHDSICSFWLPSRGILLYLQC